MVALVEDDRIVRKMSGLLDGLSARPFVRLVFASITSFLAPNTNSDVTLTYLTRDCTRANTHSSAQARMNFVRAPVDVDFKTVGADRADRTATPMLIEQVTS
jgi:hypothetical protein